MTAICSPDQAWPDGPTVHHFTAGGACSRCTAHFLDAGPVCTAPAGAESAPGGTTPPAGVMTPGRVPPIAGGDEAGNDAALDAILAAADAELLARILRTTDKAAVWARITGGQRPC